MSPTHPPHDTRCTHCGLPVPPGLVDPSSDVQFCCQGCRSVYEVLHGAGLERYYRLRESLDASPMAARTTDRPYTEYDDGVFRDLYCEQSGDGMQATELYLEGVHCAACVWLVEKLPAVAPGVLEARLDMQRSLVRVRWDDARIRLSQVARMLDSLGYPPHPAKDAQARQLRRHEDRRFLIRIGVAGACVGNVMTLAFALYGGAFSGMETQYSELFRYASVVFGLIALIWPGSLFFRGAWAALRTRSAHLDLPIALALGVGGLMGAINVVRGEGEIYFDSLTMLVFLLLVGRWIQRRQQRWASDAVELLFSVTPSSARRVEGETVQVVPVESLAQGDTIEVRAGDSVPIDGEVLEGLSSVDQSLLTGESQPVEVQAGDVVHAGTLNVAARILVRATAVGDQTRVGRLMKLVEECGRNRAPIAMFADRIAAWFVVVVLALAVMTLCVWWWRDPSRAVDNAVALLIVSCPCALGLATPLALAIALGRAAKRHILIKGGAALELLTRRGTVLLDKTGTITEGRGRVVAFVGREDAKRWVVALERHSSHPIARALLAAFADPEALSKVDSRDMEIEFTEVVQTTGGGLIGKRDGRCVMVGSPDFLQLQGVRMDREMEQALDGVIADGHTPVLLAVDGVVTAVMGIGDPLRPDAADAVAALRRMGHHVQLLSGDHPAVVARVADALEIAESDARGAATPEDKLAVVQHLVGAGHVVMVGDGVNDTAALAAASVGVAVHGGAEASLAAADIYLSRAGLWPIVELMQAAHATVRTIRRCFAASLIYNVVASSLAMTGLIGPLTAAVLMPLSSLTVVILVVTSRTFGGQS